MRMRITRYEPTGPRDPCADKKESPEIISGDSFCVRKAGLEPARPCSHKNLNLACLPIPTLPRTVDNLSELHLLVNNFFIFFSEHRCYLFGSFYYLLLSENYDHRTCYSQNDNSHDCTLYSEACVVEEAVTGICCIKF